MISSRKIGALARLVTNIGRANPNIGGGSQNVVKSDKCMGDSQILGAPSPKSTPLVRGLLEP